MKLGSLNPGLRVSGAVLLLAAGALHTSLAFDEYGSSDLIAVFFLNGAGSALVAAWIVLGRNPIAALAGAGISAVSLLAFGLSRVGDGVLGFRATGLDPVPEGVLTLVVELAALVVLGFLAMSERQAFLDSVKGALPGR